MIVNDRYAVQLPGGSLLELATQEKLERLQERVERLEKALSDYAAELAVINTASHGRDIAARMFAAIAQAQEKDQKSEADPV